MLNTIAGPILTIVIGIVIYFGASFAGAAHFTRNNPYRGTSRQILGILVISLRPVGFASGCGWVTTGLVKTDSRVLPSPSRERLRVA